jgi:hypothetical protein
LNIQQQLSTQISLSEAENAAHQKNRFKKSIVPPHLWTKIDPLNRTSGGEKVAGRIFFFQT